MKPEELVSNVCFLIKPVFFTDVKEANPNFTGISLFGSLTQNEYQVLS